MYARIPGNWSSNRLPIQTNFEDALGVTDVRPDFCSQPLRRRIPESVVVIVKPIFYEGVSDD
jgi:hypothetical protein